MKLLGISNEKTTCDCCGKEGLSRTFCVNFSDGSVMYFGCVCIQGAHKFEAVESLKIKKISIDAYQLIATEKAASKTFNEFTSEMKRKGFGAAIKSPISSAVSELTWVWKDVSIGFSEF